MSARTMPAATSAIVTVRETIDCGVSGARGRVVLARGSGLALGAFGFGFGLGLGGDFGLAAEALAFAAGFFGALRAVPALCGLAARCRCAVFAWLRRRPADVEAREEAIRHPFGGESGSPAARLPVVRPLRIAKHLHLGLQVDAEAVLNETAAFGH